jgi:hypothetical protein
VRIHPDNANHHRAAASDVSISKDAARRSVCNALFCLSLRAVLTILKKLSKWFEFRLRIQPIEHIVLSVERNANNQQGTEQ